MNEPTFYHQPVLLHECIEQLQIKPNGIYLDATFGGGGHSKEILKHLGAEGKLMVFDQDADAKKNLPNDDRVIFVPENFRYAARFVRLYKLPSLDGVLADLGVSSYQFDTAERGFSTRFDAALDMRMDNRNPQTASEILNKYPESKLQKIFEQYGEVTNAKVLAKKIVEARSTNKLTSISEFKQAISTCIYGNPHKYLAQVFQALRIEVNDELNALKDFLSSITSSLSKDGRLCIITFHSLEDRIVKNWMKNESFAQDELSFLPNHQPQTLKIITKKPILPTDKETNQNPRARSAKLRVAAKR
ncbi:MAG TPA: 16S rRNA (cytosine(1402)-N(4))-methyltransferase RsmH [Chitinophagaceae bacterium]|jgi:16S rRNA (cytosine1402-N4)-methyltransferase|nr:16S rRNA (cytosine(1402)-N(4))-methyltransferase RsmH [Chitinophagaceae bacterium]